MAKIKVILKTRYKAIDGLYPIVIKARSGNDVREINTGYKVKENQFSTEVVRHPEKEIINANIQDKVRTINNYFKECITQSRPINLKICDKPANTALFTEYLKDRAKSYRLAGQDVTAGRIEWMVRELEDMFGPVFFDRITVKDIRAYHASLKVSNNTAHKRISTLRQMFDAAINEGIYTGGNPFALLKLKLKPVFKDKLSLDEITSIENLKLRGSTDIARDMFLLSYYSKGIRFENCLFLKWSDIRQGRIFIMTNKSNKFISIQIHDKLKKILDKYSGDNFVFPLVSDIPKNKRAEVNSMNVIINRELKIIAAAAGIDKSLTFHLARHSVAFHLKQKGVNINAIKDILGHSDTATTEKYLKSLDDMSLDKELDKVYK